MNYLLLIILVIIRLPQKPSVFVKVKIPNVFLPLILKKFYLNIYLLTIHDKVKSNFIILYKGGQNNFVVLSWGKTLGFFPAIIFTLFVYFSLLRILK